MAKVLTLNLPQTRKTSAEEAQKTVKNTVVAPVVTPVTEVEKPKKLKVKLNFAKENLPMADVRVKMKIRRFLASYSFRKTQTNRLHRKAAEWFPVIEPILKKYGIPNDFKYLPLVESGLKDGTSSKGASGFWQFMPGTARTYGLRVNDKVDERKNLRKSTIAACKYLKDLHGVFDNWTLVAAAYNVGDNHMKKQINRQKQGNYYKMKLNRETGSYVYKLISMKEIVKDPSGHGYKAPKALLAYNGE
jgi:membrane-bound lytic murein transglycosylase D